MRYEDFNSQSDYGISFKNMLPYRTLSLDEGIDDFELYLSEVDMKFISELLDSISTIDKQLLLTRVQFEKIESDYKNRNRPAGILSNKLIKFAGRIDKEDLELMQEAIDSQCEKIDRDEW